MQEVTNRFTLESDMRKKGLGLLNGMREQCHIAFYNRKGKVVSIAKGPVGGKDFPEGAAAAQLYNI